MKINISLLLLLFGFLYSSCREENEIAGPQKIRFSVAPSSSTSKGGRQKEIADPVAVLAVVKDASGNTVIDKEEIALYKFNDRYLSVPVTLVRGSYSLTEFYVLGPDKKIMYVTPVEGSKYAYLVNDPLAISFGIATDSVVTVTPEVVPAEGNPEEYGYGQFGFDYVKTIDVVVSAFVKGEVNFQATEAKLKIEALDSIDSIWIHEATLQAKPNIVKVKQAELFKITVSKAGYKTYEKTQSLKAGDAIEVLLEKSEDAADVYVVGYQENQKRINVATYWVNGNPVSLTDGTHDARATAITLHNGNVYVSGYEKNAQGKYVAKYWVNGNPVVLSDGSLSALTTSIAVVSNEVYVTGSVIKDFYNKPVYWKNGQMIKLNNEFGNWENGWATDMEINGNEVYIAGALYRLITWNGNFHEVSIALYWKNEKPTLLVDLTSTYESTVSSITISGGDIYITGSVIPGNAKRKVTYWKNGTPVYLDVTPDLSGHAFGMAITDGDLYMVGHVNVDLYKGALWKNEVRMNAGIPPKSTLRNISVYESSVYLAGETTVDSTFPKAYYSVNGQVKQLSTSRSTALDLLVVKK